MKNLLPLLTLVFALQSCENKTNKEIKYNRVQETAQVAKRKIDTPKDTILISKKHKPNSIVCDIDGDNLSDTVQIVMNTINKKYGLKIIFGNQKNEYLGMGNEILGQGFDDINWVGIFEVAPKNEIYYNNVNNDGEIISEEEVKETDKIRLKNDGIFIHQAESCGGGVIYFKNGKFEWIQQE